MKLPLGKIAELISASGRFESSRVASGFSIDSRTVQPQEVFFAVRGERLDGHEYVWSALERGALAAVVRKDQLARYSGSVPLLAVDDTLEALQTLARAVRRKWGKTLIAITGSVGKTTTKEAIAHLLAIKYRVLKSEGNFNNHFGLPLMLLKLEPEHDLAVVEMGMSHAGEIRALARIAQPEIGVVTSVAPVHLEFFDSLAGIARAKYELIEALPAGGTAILNGDDDFVAKFGRGFHGKVVVFGTALSADVRAEKVQLAGGGSQFDIVLADGRRQTARLSLVGRHNISNALAALAVAIQCSLELSAAVSALSSLQPPEQRGRLIQVGDTAVINDCYNSNPKALDAMVDALSSMPAGRRIVIAGEMLELGPGAADLHRSSGRHMAGRGINVLIGVRGLAEEMVAAARAEGMCAEFVRSPEEAGQWLAREARPGDLVLLKASRGVKLERALETWRAWQAQAGLISG
ncbi:MAG: UDP-N-acetylmuramoyl-tripeptide--D-alanyl-D-alanine ligase [Acidobacteria bacterium]|nr:UDP-N-acetylmuramoyl-tripeptide--D-alanyl-D-alanine ligase [Acidobacteriota bacterium]